MKLTKLDDSEHINFPEKFMKYDECSAKTRAVWDRANKTLKPLGQEIKGMAWEDGSLTWDVGLLPT